MLGNKYATFIKTKRELGQINTFISMFLLFNLDIFKKCHNYLIILSLENK